MIAEKTNALRLAASAHETAQEKLREQCAASIALAAAEAEAKVIEGNLNARGGLRQRRGCVHGGHVIVTPT